MTTNMNFGPEWMRPAAPKRSNTLDSQNLRSLQSTSVVPNDRLNSSLTSISSLMSSHTSSLQHNYNNGLTSEHLKTSDGEGHSSAETPYKYSSAFMLSLYKPVDMPSEFERHGYVAVEESQVPLSFAPLSGEEKKLLSGPVHSDSSRRTVGSSQERGSNTGQRSNNNYMVSSSVQSPSTENTPGVPGRMGPTRSKGRMHDHFSRDQQQQQQQGTKRHEFGLDTSRQREWTDERTTNLPYESDQEESPSWDTVSQNAIGTFDSNGVFRVSSAEETELEPIQNSQEELNDSREMTRQDLRYPNSVDAFASPSATTTTTTFSGDGFGMQNEVGGSASLFGGHETRRPLTQHKWFYRDPMGNPLGPFDAHDMQAWFDAGYLSPNFLVRRDDEIHFDTLAWMIRKSGHPDKPFLTNYYGSRSRTSPDPLELGSLTPRSRGLDSLHHHHHVPATTPTNTLVSSAGLELSRGGNYFGNASQTPDILSHSAGRLGQLNLSSNYLQQVGQDTSSPHSPTAFQNSSYSGFGASLRGSREPASHWSEIPRTSSSLNSNHVELFGTGDLPAFRQDQQHLINQMNNPDLGSPGFYDYSRTLAEQRNQQQQYIQILQLQQQQQFQFQQQQALLQQQRQQFQEFQEFQQQQQQQQQQQAGFSRQHEIRRMLLVDPTNQGRQQMSVERGNIPGISTDKFLVKSSDPEERNYAHNNTTAKSLILPFSSMQLRHEVPGQPSPGLSSSESTPARPTEPMLRRDLQVEEIRRQQQARELREQETGQDRVTPENSRSAPSWGFGQNYDGGGPKRVIPLRKPDSSTNEVVSSVSETTTASRNGGPTPPPPARGSASATPKKMPHESQLEDVLKKTEGLVIAKSSGFKGWTNPAPLHPVVKTRTSASTSSAAAPSPVQSTPSRQQQKICDSVAQAKHNSSFSSLPSAEPGLPSPAAAAESKSDRKAEDALKPPSEEFMQWCRQSLRNLSSGVNGDEILQMLLSFPLDEGSSEIIQDIIYANSTSMDGRRFAEDFMRRRKEDMAGKLTVNSSIMRSAALGETAFKTVIKKGKKKTAA